MHFLRLANRWPMRWRLRRRKRRIRGQVPGVYHRRNDRGVLLSTLPEAGERSAGLRRLHFVDLSGVRNAARACRRSWHWLTAVIFACLLIGCGTRTQPAVQPSTGVAYAGPSSLNLRKDLTSRSASVGTVNHGERLDVIETRRRFVRVRTRQGLEGWTDSSLLLTSQQMDDLMKLAEGVAKLPSQGKATTFDVLNMHTDANRQSPGFFQLPEGASVDVVSHRVAPRAQPIVPKAAPGRRASTKKEKQKSSRQAAYLLPPPSPPKIPQNWEVLSRPRSSDLSGYALPAASPEHAPPPMDDWSLVRTRDNKVGWVL